MKSPTIHLGQKPCRNSRSRPKTAACPATCPRSCPWKSSWRADATCGERISGPFPTLGRRRQTCTAGATWCFARRSGCAWDLLSEKIKLTAVCHMKIKCDGDLCLSAIMSVEIPKNRKRNLYTFCVRSFPILSLASGSRDPPPPLRAPEWWTAFASPTVCPLVGRSSPGRGV